jgi:hypothetical protein
VRDKYREAMDENKKLLKLFYFIRPSFFVSALFSSSLVAMTFIELMITAKCTLGWFLIRII